MISKNTKLRIYTSLILLFLILLSINYSYVLIYVLIVFGVLSILETIFISEKLFNKKLYKYLFNIFLILYIYFFCYFFLIFSNFTQSKIIIYCLLIGCIASDIGGFIFGKLLKGPKLTKISPKKTYAGAIGSIFLTLLVISILFFMFFGKFNYSIVVLSIITSLGCQIGDLFFSYLKRKAKIKDTGNFLPGHGGILDRVDGMLFGIPSGFISLGFLF
tara:strand:+ start:2780 stop:3430 length:651 start_codon:yes stop_codon:yes gene_type:complete